VDLWLWLCLLLLVLAGTASVAVALWGTDKRHERLAVLLSLLAAGCLLGVTLVE